jgi:hypothetical protein
VVVDKDKPCRRNIEDVLNPRHALRTNGIWPLKVS